MTKQLYIRPLDELPGPLPTLTEIHAAYDEKGSSKQREEEKRALDRAEQDKYAANCRRRAAKREARAVRRAQIQEFRPKLSLLQRARVQISDFIKPRDFVYEPGAEPDSETEPETVDKPEPTVTDVRDSNHKSIYTASIASQFFIKFGPGVQEYEGRALLYLESFPDVPSPTLYAILQHGKKEHKDIYLIMEFIPGVNLSDADFDGMSVHEEYPQQITGQLHHILRALRSIPPPLGEKQPFGDIDGGPVPNEFFRPQYYYRTWEDSKNPALTGPFASEFEFNAALAENAYLAHSEPRSLLHVTTSGMRKIERTTSPIGTMTYFFKSQVPRILHSHAKVLTHSAIASENIIVRVIHPSESGEFARVEVCAIINWDKLGWYPSYWEFAMAFIHLKWWGNWWHWLYSVLEPWPLEAVLLRSIREYSTT